MVYKIGICDDDNYFINSLTKLLKKYVQINTLTFQIYSYYSGEELLASYDERHFNLLFLDMEMDGLNGIDVAKKLRISDKDISIVYTTVHEDFALQAFGVAADSYLVKPITEEMLFTSLNRILHKLSLQANLQKLHDTYISLEIKTNVIQLPYDNIIYISKVRNHLTFHTCTKDYTVYMNIKDILDKLDSSIFVKINRGEIVNWPKVSNVSNDILIINDIELAISRSHISKLNRRFREELRNFLRIRENAYFAK